jgi:ABC-type nickel/cobalt efflux system permease component RcnA
MKRLGLLVLVVVAIVAVPGLAAAHPLGNFTTNQYVEFHIAPGGLEIEHVLDLAEIPAAQELRTIDIDSDGSPSDAESERYAQQTCAAMRSALVVTDDDAAVDLSVESSVVSFPDGQAGLPTLRLDCVFSRQWSVVPSSLHFDNAFLTDRPGWRETVVTAEDVEVETDLPARSVTGKLTSYPTDGSLESVTTGSMTLLGRPGAIRGETVTAAASAVTPVDHLANLLSPGGGSPALPIAMMVAVGLGVLHAMAPGHGKTVMAAYLIGSRGTIRQAVGLGAVVAASHTVGVLALGGVALIATSSFAPARLYPVLSTVSGMIVVSVGLSMLVGWWRHRGHRRAHDHGDDHSHGHDHHHSHDHGHDHHHPVLDGKSGWKVLTALGLSGGLVPSTSAVVLLLGAVNLGRVPIGILLIVLFGIGMAATLTSVGLFLVVAGKKGTTMLETKAPRMSRLTGALRPGAAVFVIAAGAVLTINALASSVG